VTLEGDGYSKMILLLFSLNHTQSLKTGAIKRSLPLYFLAGAEPDSNTINNGYKNIEVEIRARLNDIKGF